MGKVQSILHISEMIKHKEELYEKCGVTFRDEDESEDERQEREECAAHQHDVFGDDEEKMLKVGDGIREDTAMIISLTQHVCMCVYVCVWICVWICVCTCVCVCVCVCVCMCVCIDLPPALQ